MKMKCVPARWYSRAGTLIEVKRERSSVHGEGDQHSNYKKTYPQIFRDIIQSLLETRLPLE